MQNVIQVQNPVEALGDTELVVVELANVAGLTLGDGGSGREDKRKEYN
jgi:hypothetical protein